MAEEIRVREGETDRLFEVFAALTVINNAQQNEWFVKRLKSKKGVWRDFRLVAAKLESISAALLETWPVKKVTNIRYNMDRLRFSLTLGKVAAKTLPDSAEIIDREHVNTLIEFAWKNTCPLCEGTKCKQCPLGQVLEAVMPLEPNGGSWALTDLGEMGALLNRL